MRTPWEDGFPPVIIHRPWQGDEGGLADNVHYWPAKKKRDLKAANRLCFEETQSEKMEQIYAVWEGLDIPPPLVIAPAMNLLESQNVLALGYAQNLAFEMSWKLAPNIHQAVSVKRDFVTDGWFRITHQPEFYGEVESDRHYVLADDVCTMGGTLASLKGFIESKGGRVICMTTLGGPTDAVMDIAISERTLYSLEHREDGEFAEIVRKELGYGIECLTEPEGRFLLRCTSPEHLRAGIDGARNS